jgi:uncharacterized protein YcbK (DUF882 family)
MSSRIVGRIGKLNISLRKLLSTAALSAALLIGSGIVMDSGLKAGGETRTIELYHVHTKENLKVTYMQNGRYVPSAMKKLNHFFRDWRRGEVTKIDPVTVDLIYELHADLNSRRPVHVVSGYRSPKTNAFLKRIGRNVAKRSQHMAGKAIDFYFPDIPTKKIRNAALFRKVGGVGYYRSSGGPTGFMHLDSGRVRHWGPRISPREMVAAVAEGRKVAGTRMKRKGTRDDAPTLAVAEANASGGLINRLFGNGKKNPKTETVEAEIKTAAVAYTDMSYEGYDEEDMAELAGKASKSDEPAINASDSATLSKLVGENAADTDSELNEEASNEPITLAKGYPVPKPRLRPNGVMMLAAADLQIIPASGPPEPQIAGTTNKQGKFGLGITRQTLDDPSLANMSEEIATENELLIEQASLPEDGTAQLIDRNSKADVSPSILVGLGNEAPVFGKEFVNSGIQSFAMTGEEELRRSGEPPTIGQQEISVLPMPKVLEDEPETQHVNREGKGNMPRITFKLSKVMN